MPAVVPAQTIQQTDSIGTPNYPIDEVVVTGSRTETDVRHLPMTVSVVGRAKIEKQFQPSILPTLAEQVPGLFITSRGVMGYGVSTGSSGSMSLRGIGGSPTTGLLVLIDGHPQYMGLMGHPMADAYQSMLAQKVEVVRGPASVLYGSNAMGGVINIVTRKQQTDGVKTNISLGYGSYNTLMTEASNQMRRNRLSTTITASYNRTDGHRPDMEFEQYGGYAKLGYDLAQAWSAFADVNITHFNASNPGTVQVPLTDNDSRITRGMASVAVENKYERTSGALKFFYNWGRHRINEGYAAGVTPPDFRFNSRDRMLGINWYQSASLFAGNRATVGVDYTRFGGEAWNRFVADGREEETINRSQNEVAAYVDFRQAITRFLSVDAGIRWDRHSLTGTEWIPQFGLSARLPRNASLKAVASKGFRNPTIRELYMFRPANPELMPERLWNYELSYSQHLLDRRLHYGINLFYIKGDNMIQTQPVEGRPLNVNTGRVENRGVELHATYRPDNRWNLTANYSWLHMEYALVAAPGHKLFAGADYSQGRWSVSAGMQYIGGLYTAIAPAKVKEDFLLCNLRASYQLCPIAHLFVRGENLLAQKYEINAGYPMPKATVMAGVGLKF
ncbi:TonB-dependent receptor [Bacteroides sp. OttesenSCG-928-D19]|nr:TonB-dependent receptor [Bacteroides sp. OttesenSCG-928-N06]MDL2304815.1 TonB-dependent receptor [Bacteroides sp. OttesenSCG-928-D19]